MKPKATYRRVLNDSGPRFYPERALSRSGLGYRLGTAAVHALARDTPARVWVTAVAISLLTWPVETLDPGSLPESWPVGLHLAAVEGLRFGHDVTFTYGPLAFLTFPVLVSSTTAILAFSFSALLHTALAAALLATLRGAMAWPAAVAATVAMCGLPLPLSEAPVVISLLGVVYVLQRADVASAVLVPAGGAVAALELLVKINDGVICVALAALGAWFVRPRGLRAEGILAASFLSSLLALWVGSGMDVRDLPAWARLSAHLIQSYAQGMEAPSIRSDLSLALLLFATTVLIAVAEAMKLGRARGAALLLAVTVFEYGYFKEGFVRSAWSHSIVCFSAFAICALIVGRSSVPLRLSGVALAGIAVMHMATATSPLVGLLIVAAALEATLRGEMTSRLRVVLFVLVGAIFLETFVEQSVQGAVSAKPVWLAAALLVIALAQTVRPLRLAAVAAVAAAMLVLVLSPAGRLDDLLPRHGAPASTFVSQARLLASTSRRRALLADYRLVWRHTLPIPSAVLRDLRKGTVDVETESMRTSWAYGFRWSPQPMLENYALYDRVLDTFAADALAARGPDRILQSWAAIDEQSPMWQGPGFVLSELCHYRLSRTEDLRPYALLVRVPNRCGSARSLGTVSIGSQQWVRVPSGRAHEVVYGTIRFPTAFVSMLRAAIYKPGQIEVLSRPGGLLQRFIAGTSTDPHILALPPLGDLAAPSGLDVTALQFRNVTGPIRVSFFALPIER